MVGADRLDAALRDAAAVRRARRHRVRAQRGHQHRPRGHDADGRVLRHLRVGPARLVGRRHRRRADRGRPLALVHAAFSIHLRADQVVSGTAVNFLALGITGYMFIDHYGDNGTPDNISRVPDVNLPILKAGSWTVRSGT